MSLTLLLTRTELIHILLDHFSIIYILISGMLFSHIAYVTVPCRNRRLFSHICDPLSENLAHRTFYENRDKTGNLYTNV